MLFDFISSLHDSVIAHPDTGAEIDSAVREVKEEDGETSIAAIVLPLTDDLGHYYYLLLTVKVTI